jgi:hypothetical protein
MKLEWKYDKGMEGRWHAGIENISLRVAINSNGFFEATVDNFCITTTAESLEAAQEKAIAYSRSKIRTRITFLESLLDESQAQAD